jgi:hypothetical protein
MGTSCALHEYLGGSPSFVFSPFLQKRFTIDKEHAKIVSTRGEPPTASHSSSTIIRGWFNEPTSVRGTKRTKFHPPQEKKPR